MKIVLGILAALVLLAAGCGGSTVNVTEEVSAVFANANCNEDGFEAVAGEREQVYSCSYGRRRAAGTYRGLCVAVMEGEVYVLRRDYC